MPSSEYRSMHSREERHWWYSALRRLVHSEAGKEAAGPSRILDAGCGTGGNLKFLSALFPKAEVCGMDLHPLALSLARSKADSFLSQGSVHRFPFPDAVFDLVLCLDVLDVRGVDDRTALGECRRVLKEGGLLLVNVPALECLRGAHDRVVQRRRRYTAAELRTKLQEQGFTVRRLTYWNALLLPVIFLVRKVWSVKGGKDGVSDLKDLHPAVNRTMDLLLRFEAALLSFTDLPLGASVFAAAGKVSRGPAGDGKGKGPCG